MFWQRQWDFYLAQAERTPLHLEAWRFTLAMTVIEGLMELWRGKDMPFTSLVQYAAIMFVTSMLGFGLTRRFARRKYGPSPIR